MKSTIHHKPQELSRSILLLLLGLYLLSAVACTTHHERGVVEIDTAQLRPGNMILRRGEGMLSTFFSKIASREQLYSHCGIIDYDSTADRWIVWHAYQDGLIGADGIYAQSLDTFLMESEAASIYPALLLDSLSLERMRAYIELHRPEGRCPKRFDTHFNLQDTTTVYCTEFVALAYGATGIPAYQVEPTGHSITIPYPYYTLDDLIRSMTRLQVRN